MSRDLWPELKSWIQDQAPVQIAAGDVRALKPEFELGKFEDLGGLDFAVSLAYPLPRAPLAGISDRPTLLYKHVYTQLNHLMDRVALGLALRLEASGARAIPVPASQIIDWNYPMKAHVNHRQVAVHLGQGWYGRNNLLVTPARGAKVRLVTILTDAPVLEPGPWLGRSESGCQSCAACVPACPAGAIPDGPGEFNLAACAERNRENEKVRGIGQRICGVCVKACDGPR